MKKKQIAKAVEQKNAGLLPGQDYLILTDLTVAAVTGDRNDEALREDVIGGFHTLCAGVGDIPGHPLSGFRAADILPQSLWNGYHRPASGDPRGFVYDPASDLWVSIYLAQDDRDLINLPYEKFVSYGQERGCRLLTNEEFASAAEGSNEMTNIKDSCRPKGSGGHVDRLGRRMVSNIGCEDCCGVLWQYISTPHPVESEWALVAGGDWYNEAACGSRSRETFHYPRVTYSYVGARFASEPLHKRVVR
jgi:hypothetical protein